MPDEKDIRFKITDFIPDYYDPGKFPDCSPVIHALQSSSLVRTLNRAASCMSFLLFHRLSMGSTLDEIQRMNQSERRAMGRDALKFLEEHPADPNLVNEHTRRESLKAYGELYAKASEQLLKEPFPKLDLAHPEQMSQEDYKRLSTIRDMCMDYLQTKDGLMHEMPFVEAMGGPDQVLATDYQLQATAVLTDYFAQAEQPLFEPVDAANPANAALTKYIADTYGNPRRTAQVKKLDDIKRVLAKDKDHRQINAEAAMGLNMANAIPKEQLEDYLSGKGPLFTPDQEKQLKADSAGVAAATQIRGNQSDEKLRANYGAYRKMEDWRRSIDQTMRKDNIASNRENQKMMVENAGEDYIYLGNLISDKGKVYTDLAKNIRQRRNELNFIADQNQAAAAFVLEQIEQVSHTIIENTAEVGILLTMQDQLNKGMEPGASILPAGPERTAALADIQKRLEAAKKPLTLGAYEQEKLTLLYSMFDNIKQNTIDMGSEFHRMENPKDVNPQTAALYSDRIRPRIEAAIQNQPDPQLRALGFEGLLNIRSLPPRLPQAVTMDFHDNPDFNFRDFASHMGKRGAPAPTEAERLYGVATFDETFAALYTEEQAQWQKDASIDPFDLISIDGKSVNELYGKKYAALDPRMRQHMIKCEVTNAALNSDRAISFSLIQEDGQHKRQVSQSIAVNRSGNLHEPKLTFGQRFLKGCRISKYPPAKDTWRAANNKEGESRAIGDRFLQERKGFFESAIRKGQMTALETSCNGANRFDTEFKRLIGADIKQLGHFKAKPEGTPAGMSGFLSLFSTAGSTARPTGLLSVLYGQMLKSGMPLKDIMDPAARAQEKKVIAEKTNERLKDPVEMGKVLAESTKAYLAMDMKKEFGNIAGKNIQTAEDMEMLFTDPDLAVQVLPSMHFFYTATRELHQVTNSFVPKQVGKEKELVFLNAAKLKELASGQKTTLTFPEVGRPLEYEEKDPARFATYKAYADTLDVEDLAETFNLTAFDGSLMTNRLLMTYMEDMTKDTKQLSLPELQTTVQKAQFIRGLFSKMSETGHIGEVHCTANEGVYMSPDLSEEAMAGVRSMSRETLEGVMKGGGPQAAAPQAAAPQAAAPQADAPQADAPQADAPQAAAPQADAPQADAPQAAAPQAAAPQADAPQADAPQAAAPQAAAPQADAPQADAPQAAAPQAAAPQADAPQADAPQADAPQAAAPQANPLRRQISLQDMMRQVNADTQKKAQSLHGLRRRAASVSGPSAAPKAPSR